METRKIPLTRGKHAVVDKEDFDYLNQWKWNLLACGYASRTQYLGGGRKNEKKMMIYMHSVINKTPKGLRTDHINHNTLDNRRCNLRTVTASQNGINRKGLQINNKSGYAGVYWSQNRWNAEIKINQIKIFLGCFKDKADAILARKNGELKYHCI